MNKIGNLDQERIDRRCYARRVRREERIKRDIASFEIYWENLIKSQENDSGRYGPDLLH